MFSDLQRESQRWWDNREKVVVGQCMDISQYKWLTKLLVMYA